MKILFLADIISKPGREAVKKALPDLKKKFSPHIIIANGENLAGGTGFTAETIEEMRKTGIDFFTTGNHTWKHKDDVDRLNDKKFPVIRPANYPEGVGVPGRGFQIVETNMMQKILVINLLGRVFMGNHVDCPFRAFDRILKETAHERLDAVFVDFHAEATSEKTAFAHYVDGRASVVVGTHTHVATRDERILAGGTAFISDVGMCGPIDSVIGVRKDLIINHFITQLPYKIDIAEGDAQINGVFIETDDQTKKAKSIEFVCDIIRL